MLITLFPVWAVGTSLTEYQWPTVFVSIGPGVVRTSLVGVMLSMEQTLTDAELRAAAARPTLLTLGLLGCFVGMPALAVALSAAFALPPSMHTGLLLLGVVSGGCARPQLRDFLHASMLRKVVQHEGGAIYAPG